MKSYLWYAQYPGEFYALSFRFDSPVNERTARARMRRFIDRDRLPCGTSVWSGN